jgi:hypothetical protein
MTLAPAALRGAGERSVTSMTVQTRRATPIAGIGPPHAPCGGPTSKKEEMMAYLEFAPAGVGAIIDRPNVTSFGANPRSFAAAATGFTQLEWQVVDLAQRDRLSSINRPGPIARALHWLFGGAVKTALSDPRLEALRRIAVLSWYRGFSVAPAEVRAFLAAGFTVDQYETLLARINAIRTNLPRSFRR